MGSKLLPYRRQVQFLNGFAKAVREDACGDVFVGGVGNFTGEGFEEEGAEGEYVVGGVGSAVVDEAAEGDAAFPKHLRAFGGN